MLSVNKCGIAINWNDLFKSYNVDVIDSINNLMSWGIYGTTSFSFSSSSDHLREEDKTHFLGRNKNISVAWRKKNIRRNE